MRTDQSAVCVFLGPSLDLDQARAILPDATFLPPAGLGDIHALALRKDVRAICLIDGRFQATPAVWHKEILFALSRGIAVLGAASMGALRAAEMCSLGMQGVGKVFEQYAGGVLEDDDEVAVLHGPAELGYPGVSYAMASLRHACERARAAGLVDARGAAAICRHMKALHFTLRSRDQLERIVHDVAGAPHALLEFVTAPEQDLKRLDALALLQLVAAGGIVFPLPGSFEETAHWRMFAERQQSRLRYPAMPGPSEVVWGYFNLRANAGAGERNAAWMETLEALVARMLSLEPDASAVRSFLELLRRERGLLDPAAVQAWSAERECDSADLLDWAHARARRQMLQSRFKPTFLVKLQAAAMRSDNCTEVRQALAQRAALAPGAVAQSASADRIPALWKIYCDVFGGRATPLQLAADDKGFDTPDAFLDALLREYLLATAPVPADESESMCV